MRHMGGMDAVRFFAAALAAILLLSRIDANTPAFDVEPATALALTDDRAARRMLEAGLRAALPVGTSRAGLLAWIDALRRDTRTREELRGDDVGDPDNIRDCRPAGPRALDCFWFLLVPQAHRAEALAEGLYGLTWVIRFTFDAGDRLLTIAVDVLPEQL